MRSPGAANHVEDRPEVSYLRGVVARLQHAAIHAEQKLRLQAPKIKWRLCIGWCAHGSTSSSLVSHWMPLVLMPMTPLVVIVNRSASSDKVLMTLSESPTSNVVAFRLRSKICAGVVSFRKASTIRTLKITGLVPPEKISDQVLDAIIKYRNEVDEEQQKKDQEAQASATTNPSDFGDLRLGRAIRQWPESIEAVELWIADFRLWDFRFRFGKRRGGEAALFQLPAKVSPRNEKRIARGDLLCVSIRLRRQSLRLTEQKDGFLGQIIEQGRQHSRFGRGNLNLQDAQLASRWQRDLRDLLARNLRHRIELAQGFEFVTKKFQPHRPRTGGRKNIHDTAAHGDLAALRHLGLGFIPLFFQPLDEIKRIRAIAACQLPDATDEFRLRERFLQQRRDIRHHES